MYLVQYSLSYTREKTVRKHYICEKEADTNL